MRAFVRKFPPAMSSVKREFFNYFLIEEKGALRVFTLSLRTKDRL